MADCRRESICLDAGLFFLLLLHHMQFIDDFSRCIIHVQLNCRHTQICLLFHSHRDKAIRQLASQRLRYFFTCFLGAFDLVDTLLVCEIFFDGMLDDFLNRLILMIRFQLLDYCASVSNRLGLKLFFVNQGKLCGLIVVDDVSVVVVFILLENARLQRRVISFGGSGCLVLKLHTQVSLFEDNNSLLQVV